MTQKTPNLLENHPSHVVVIISNGPGELTTWVKPIADRLHSKLLMQPYQNNAEISLRLVLVPCPNATGSEHKVAEQWGQFEKITTAKNFWKLLLNPKKFGFWPSQGIVIFLGGDQFWSVLLAARLKYKNMTYAEWIARWPQWNDRIFAMSPKVKELLPKKMKQRCSVVGDLMADLKVEKTSKNDLPKGDWIALLPGSKKAKLCIGIPFFLETADHISKKLPEKNFLIPIAPTTDIKEFIYYSGKHNPISQNYSSGIQNINYIKEEEKCLTILTTIKGTKIHLIKEYPAYQELIQCELAITTVGANTAELGALGIPMLVVLPTQHLHVMQAWDGFLGILGRFPLFKWLIGLLLSLWRLRKKTYLAWPNISAKRMIVPERMGEITPIEIAREAIDWVNSPKRLEGQKEDLRSLRGKTGAIEKITKEIINSMPHKYIQKR